MRLRLLVFSLFALTLATLATLTAAAPSAAVFGFSPTSVTVPAGGAGVVDLRLSGAQNLGGYEVELTFDPAVVRVDRVERIIGTAAQPTPGRDWTAVPISNDPNVTYQERGAGVIAFGAFSIADPSTPGASGTVTLARLHLRGVDGGTSPLSIRDAVVSNTEGITDTWSVSAGQVQVTGSAYRLYLPLLARRATAGLQGP